MCPTPTTKNRLITIAASLHSSHSKKEEEEEEEHFDTTMNTQMGSTLPSEKLNRNNFASWEYKMSGPKLETNFKMKKRVRSGRYVGKGERIIRIY